jgi:acyl carrier protein
MIPNDRVAEVVSRLTGVSKDELMRGKPQKLPLFCLADSLDTVELIMELEEEFDKETIRWALRYVEALTDRSFLTEQAKILSARSLVVPDPLWDRDLDG